ncbi:MAG: DNA repair protein RadA [Longimicrobiales bacterium]
MTKSKTKVAFFCIECGNETPRWQGQCPACSGWNTLREEPSAPKERGSGRLGGKSVKNGAPHAVAARLGDVDTTESIRWTTGLDELDFVMGGGIVPGSIVLLGGEPGIGKSTLLLQVAARLHAGDHKTLYVSGEESAPQVRMRADRLMEKAEDVIFLCETRLDAILAAAEEHKPAALIVDSIQTTYSHDLEGAPGNVTQVRECAASFQRFAKETGTAVFLVGHVTKGGTVAGPKTLEHIVDTVVYFEAAAGLDHRVLRATKNRFGGVDEIGVFRMTPGGLVPVANPSELFLGERHAGVSGTAVAAIIEGTRPLLIEVQALCARSTYGAAQRVSTGFDRQRLALLLAVLEKRAGIPFAETDVFLNVVGGVRIEETGSDLAIAAALISAALDRPAPSDAVFLGEVGLGGEIRATHQLERRLTEAARMGFRSAFLSPRAISSSAPRDLKLHAVADIKALLAMFRA